jgi:hypothetical protein
MIPDELEALVVADSVGALDPDERVDLQARLAVLTPDERSEVARLYDAATAMAASVPPLEPPAHVRERRDAQALALHRVGGRRRVDRHRPARDSRPGPRRRQGAIARHPGRVLRAGDFHHADEDSDHGEITTTEGAEVLVVGAVEDYLPGAAALNHESG